ncbi:MAG: undecaprenyldiphospho-muramoylpentapeptide beta-N-acetylglucosaminyltransferase [Defluviitaleaceae bacterium]|nr:undecaprenyldiphospho-muramoylpentapeptide beta-N-acetylglucosaminyltransferase [Defluviitaleaceae bacterium]
MKIVLTGGGTAGHVVPNLALVPHLADEGFEINYIGGKGGMEEGLVAEAGLPYHAISAGKLRRYLSLKNIADGFRVIKGVRDARKVLRKIKPDVVFSKGGFVTVPVVFAAKMAKIPVVIHESDFTIGLANKLAIPRAKKVCCVFPETIKHIKDGKGVHTGTPIRKEVFNGNAKEALKHCGFVAQKPVILVMGGSLGSVAINTILRQNLDVLLKKYNIIHICGKDNVENSLKTTDRAGYAQFEYISQGMGDFYALADIVVARAGSNSLAEFLALKKPNVLIPLPKAVSRGDQILNAASFEKQGFSVVLQEEDITNDVFVKTIDDTFANRAGFISVMENSATGGDGSKQIVDIIKSVLP